MEQGVEPGSGSRTQSRSREQNLEQGVEPEAGSRTQSKDYRTQSRKQNLQSRDNKTFFNFAYYQDDIVFTIQIHINYLIRKIFFNPQKYICNFSVYFVTFKMFAFELIQNFHIDFNLYERKCYTCRGSIFVIFLNFVIVNDKYFK